MSEAYPSRSLAQAQFRSLILGRLHSLSGALAIGAFLLVHLWREAHGLTGQAQYDDAKAHLFNAPFALWCEVLFIYVPVLYHALYGMSLVVRSRPNLGRYPYTKNWAYTLQRATGVLAFLFIAYHFWQFRLQVFLGNMQPVDFYPELCATLSSTTKAGIPLVSIAYLIGVAACAYHFANGLYGFCCSWGVTTSRRTSQLLASVFGVVGVVVFAMGSITVIYFATGSAFFAGAGHDPLYREAHAGLWATCRDVTSPDPAVEGVAPNVP